MKCLPFTLSLLFLAYVPARAQVPQSIPIAMRFVAAEANAPPGTCGCFWLKGAALDAAFPLLPRLSGVVEVAGITVDRVPQSQRGLSTVTLFAGPRYTQPLGRRASLQAQALFGAARGFDSDFLVGAQRADTATAFGFATGAALEVPLTPSIALRAVQVEYLQTNLPNGVDNRQRNIRLGTGLVFHLPLPAQR